MRRLIIKSILFVLITLLALFNYRIITIYNYRLMIANTDQRESWSEIFNVIPDTKKAEYYEPPYELRPRESLEYEYYVVLYTNKRLYNIRATEFDIERLTRLLDNEQVLLLEHEPVALWFYGLLYVVVIIFPLMRKIEIG